MAISLERISVGDGSVDLQNGNLLEEAVSFYPELGGSTISFLIRSSSNVRRGTNQVQEGIIRGYRGEVSLLTIDDVHKGLEIPETIGYKWDLCEHRLNQTYHKPPLGVIRFNEEFVSEMVGLTTFWINDAKHGDQYRLEKILVRHSGTGGKILWRKEDQDSDAQEKMTICIGDRSFNSKKSDLRIIYEDEKWINLKLTDLNITLKIPVFITPKID